MLPSFFPSLGSTTRVAVGSAQEQASVHVSFVARLSDSDYAEAFNTGARVEIWTDAPTPGKPNGEWSAVPFEYRKRDAQQATSEIVLDITTGQAIEQSQIQSKEDGHILYAQLHLPKSAGERYSFTYRLVYPSGVQWLGYGSNNGVLEAVADDGFFQETGLYLPREDLRVIQVRKEDGDSVPVGQLLTDQWRWSGWAVDESR